MATRNLPDRKIAAPKAVIARAPRPVASSKANVKDMDRPVAEKVAKVASARVPRPVVNSVPDRKAWMVRAVPVARVAPRPSRISTRMVTEA